MSCIGKVVLLLTTQSQLLTTLKKEPFENIVGKEENAGDQHFLLFQQCFLCYPEQILPFELTLICRLQTLSIWIGLKFRGLVKRFNSLLPEHSTFLRISAFLNICPFTQTQNFQKKNWGNISWKLPMCREHLRETKTRGP